MESPGLATPEHRLRRSLPAMGVILAVALVALAMVLPAVTGWDVHVRWFPPLHARWQPRVGPGTPIATVIAVAGVIWRDRLAARLSWRRLLLLAWGGGVAWMLALGLVDGPAGLGHILDTDYEYLPTARATDDIGHLLRIYVSKIGYAAPTGNWPVHVAGHPPGALLFFVMLTRIGISSAVGSGLVVIAVAATTSVAVMITADLLAGRDHARRAAVFLVLGPAAIWQGVSADAVFAAIAAWGLAALALAATRTGLFATGSAVVAGMLLGYAVMMSYGLILLGILAVSILLITRTWRPLAPAALAALAVVGGFAVAGFWWWDGLVALRGRYWDGVASNRPAAYWIWGDIAALVCSAGPLLGAGLAVVAAGVRTMRDKASVAIASLSTAAALTVLIADASQMSKAEVERIWLPFVPWLLLSCALLPPRWRRGGLVLQVATALLIQHLLFTGW